ncbi:MAG: radical SAM protein [Polyangiaceae bacterium]
MTSRSPLVLIPEHFGSLVFDRRTSRYAPFDHETKALLLAARTTSIFELAGAERDPVRRDHLEGFAEAFSALGYFAPDGRFAAEVLDLDPPADHLTGPLAVHLEIIAACNLHCSHCFAGELPRRSDLTLAELDGLFAELAAIGAFRLGLTGGEPLLRKDLLDIVDAAIARGLHPCLTTNATLLDERWARELGERELAWINVSLDGATAASNDAVRGAGTFDEVVGRLRAYGRHMRFTLAFTLTRDNVSTAEDCARLARELGAANAVFRPVYPVGVARSHPELMPAFGDYTAALEALCAQGEVGAIDPFGPTARRETQARTYSPPGCGAAHLVASISSTGQVNPCSYLGSAFDSGSIRDKPFREIWSSAAAFRRLRGRPAARGLAGSFQGGCRARALAAHGDVDAPDPWHAEWRAHEEGDRWAPLATHLVERERKRLPVFPEGGA